MLETELLRVQLFLSAVLAVYVLALASLLRVLRRRGKIGRFDGAVFAAAALGFACMAYGRFIEPYWPEIVRVKIPTDKIAGRPVRCAHVSDLHFDVNKQLEDRLPGLIAGLKPDLIVFTGDSINTPAALPAFKAFLSSAAAIAPTFVVRGNWDAWFWNELDLFGGTGARELTGAPQALTVDGSRLQVGGAPVGMELRGPLAALKPGPFNIFLYHYPDEIGAAARSAVDLYCAGHTHGGQVALPLYGALMTLSRFDKLYEAGLYRVKETWLYVNRGIGMEGGHAPRVRFWARPEITLYEIGAPSSGPRL